MKVPLPINGNVRVSSQRIQAPQDQTSGIIGNAVDGLQRSLHGPQFAFGVGCNHVGFDLTGLGLALAQGGFHPGLELGVFGEHMGFSGLTGNRRRPESIGCSRWTIKSLEEGRSKKVDSFASDSFFRIRQKEKAGFVLGSRETLVEPGLPVAAVWDHAMSSNAPNVLS